MVTGSIFGNILVSLKKILNVEKLPIEVSTSRYNARGKIIWDPENCSGCMLCVNDCPSFALSLILVDKKHKRYIMRYNLGQCIFCRQCELSCDQSCFASSLGIKPLSTKNKDMLEIIYGRQEDINTYKLSVLKK